MGARSKLTMPTNTGWILYVAAVAVALTTLLLWLRTPSKQRQLTALIGPICALLLFLSGQLVGQRKLVQLSPTDRALFARFDTIYRTTESLYQETAPGNQTRGLDLARLDSILQEMRRVGLAPRSRTHSTPGAPTGESRPFSPPNDASLSRPPTSADTAWVLNSQVVGDTVVLDGETLVVELHATHRVVPDREREFGEADWYETVTVSESLDLGYYAMLDDGVYRAQVQELSFQKVRPCRREPYSLGDSIAVYRGNLRALVNGRWRKIPLRLRRVVTSTPMDQMYPRAMRRREASGKVGKVSGLMTEGASYLTWKEGVWVGGELWLGESMLRPSGQ